MPSAYSLRRLARLAQQVHKDLKRGGMGINFKYLFRSTAIMSRVVARLADHVATEAGAPEEVEPDAAPEKPAPAVSPDERWKRADPRAQSAQGRPATNP